MDYDTYQRSNEGGKNFILRNMFAEHAMMKQAINTLAQELQELKAGKGVPQELKKMEAKLGYYVR